MSASHTPGPWRIRLYATDDDPAELIRLGLKPVRLLNNDGSIVVSGENGRIAVVDCQSAFKRGHGHTAECVERDANARLIAAAPDLLAAGRLVMASAQSLDPDMTAAYAAMRAAIAAAEPQS